MLEMKKPSNETLQQIDFVIQGLENGKYKELAKEVEFHQKLKGDDDPNYIQSLIHALEAAQIDIVKLTQLTDQQHTDIVDLRNRIVDLEDRERTNQSDISTLGKGMKYAIDPSPLDKNYELNEISNWLTNKGIY
jgi:hypothetical protein